MKQVEIKNLPKLVDLMAVFFAYEGTRNNPLWHRFMRDDKMKSVVCEILKLNLQNHDSIYEDLDITRLALIGSVAKVVLTLGSECNNRIVRSHNPSYIAKRLEKLSRESFAFAKDLARVIEDINEILPLEVFEAVLMNLEVDLHNDQIAPETYDNEELANLLGNNPQQSLEILKSIAVINNWLSQWTFPRTPNVQVPYRSGKITYIMDRNKGVAVLPSPDNTIEEYVYIDLTFDSEVWTIEGMQNGGFNVKAIDLLRQEIQCKDMALEYLIKYRFAPQAFSSR